MACRRAVEFSRDVGFSRLIIEEDCLNVMRLYLIPQRIDCCLAIFMMISSSTLRGMQVLSFNWVKRGENMVAHSLAEHARNLLEDLYWIEDTPLPVANTL